MRWLKTVNGSRNNIGKQLFSFPPISFLAILPPFCPLTSYSHLPHSVWFPLHRGTSGKLLRYPIATDIDPRILLLSAPHHQVYHDEHRPHGSSLSLGGLSAGARQSRVVLMKFLSWRLNSCSRGPGLCDTSDERRAQCGSGDDFTLRGSLETYCSNVVATRCMVSRLRELLYPSTD
ncbi:hypothetical protein B0H13DRAFT_2287130 [Mycena leptocephala]|nr:hypothetical protein B0H13DRAFT_2287130 [Mycena leptocephala]